LKKLIIKFLKKIFIFIPNKIIIFLLNKNKFLLIKLLLTLFGYKDLMKRLNNNGLIVVDILKIDISNLYILRNVYCEIIQSNDKSLISFLENYIIEKGDLSLKNSFHYQLFKKLSKNENEIFNPRVLDYFKWHQSLNKENINNRSEEWILNKIQSCKRLFYSIKSNGFKDYDLLNLPLILNEPLIETRYKYDYKISGYEIFDGHHRVACAKALGYEKIFCILCKDIATKTPFGIKINEINK